VVVVVVVVVYDSEPKPGERCAYLYNRLRKTFENGAHHETSQRHQVVEEIDRIPLEYLPWLLQMVRAFREA